MSSSRLHLWGDISSITDKEETKLRTKEAKKPMSNKPVNVQLPRQPAKNFMFSFDISYFSLTRTNKWQEDSPICWKFVPVIKECVDFI